MGMFGRTGDSSQKEQPVQSPRPASHQVQVQLGEKEAEGIYSNLVLISHSTSEFILDFARMLPGVPKAKVYSRIVMTPQNAKSLHAVLARNLETYEQKHGKITAAGTPESTREIGFK